MNSVLQFYIVTSKNSIYEVVLLRLVTANNNSVKTFPPPLACNEPTTVILLLSLDIMTTAMVGNSLWLMKLVLLVDKGKSD